MGITAERKELQLGLADWHEHTIMRVVMMIVFMIVMIFYERKPL